jgi:hypothetical protein
MENQLPPIKCKRKIGEERFRFQGEPLDFDLIDFWQWMASDLVSNATRGRLAEYLVARALGIPTCGIRDEWAAYDLCMPNGIKVEVKSAAYIQSWYQKEYSTIIFNVPKTRSWDPDTNRQSNEVRRQVDVYIFALLAHQDKSTIDPMDVDQWEFYILSSKYLNERTRSQVSITLNSLRKENAGPIKYQDIKSAVHKLSNEISMPGTDILTSEQSNENSKLDVT